MISKYSKLVLLLGFFWSIGSQASPLTDKRLIVNPKVRTSSSVDLSSLESIRRDIIKPTMSDREKAIAVWRFLHFYSYPGVYPTEDLTYWASSFDTVKALNMYPWGECGWYQFMLHQLWTKVAGLEARCKIVSSVAPAGKDGNGHWISEVFYDDAWHHLDAYYDVYLLERDARTIADMNELCADHSLMTDPAEMEGIRDGRDPNFLKKLAPTYLYTRIIDCSRPSGNHTMTINLARGDEYIISSEKESDLGWENRRYWYFPPDIGKDMLERCQKRQAYTIGGPGDKGPDRAFNERNDLHRPLTGFSNSKLIYTPNFKNGSYIDRITEKNNIKSYAEDALKPLLHTETAGKAGHVIFEISAPYVMVAGKLEAKFKRMNENDSFKIAVSKDNSKNFSDVLVVKDIGKGDLELDITEQIYGSYKYWIRFDFQAEKNNTDVGLDSLKITTIFQSTPAAPAKLVEGRNIIKVNIDNPEILKENDFYVEYCWKGRELSTGKQKVRKDMRKIFTSPYVYEINCLEEEPITRYVRMIIK